MESTALAARLDRLGLRGLYERGLFRDLLTGQLLDLGLTLISLQYERGRDMIGIWKVFWSANGSGARSIRVELSKETPPYSEGARQAIVTALKGVL